MTLRKFILELGTSLLIPVAFFFDWVRLSQLSEYATGIGLARISTNPFMSSKDVQRIKKSLPTGDLRNRIKFFEVAAALCWIGFGVASLVSILKKHGL